MSACGCFREEDISRVDVLYAFPTSILVVGVRLNQHLKRGMCNIFWPERIFAGHVAQIKHVRFAIFAIQIEAVKQIEIIVRLSQSNRMN